MCSIKEKLPLRDSFSVPQSSEISIDGMESEEKEEESFSFVQHPFHGTAAAPGLEQQQQDSQEGDQEDQISEIGNPTRFSVLVNRMGTAAETASTTTSASSRRKFRAQLLGPRRRSQRVSPTFRDPPVL